METMGKDGSMTNLVMSGIVGKIGDIGNQENKDNNAMGNMKGNDTVHLLRECDAGLKMGITSIEEVYDSVHATELGNVLVKAKKEHEALEQEVERMLSECDAEEKEPNVMAKTMSWMKTNVKLVADGSDKTVADLITDGCNMGIKSLYRYLNQYKAAEDKVKDLVRKTIKVEEHMREEMCAYL